MSWAALFDRASGFDITEEAIQAQESDDWEPSDPPDSLGERDYSEVEERDDTQTVGVVADASVLAADLLVDGPARDALDHVRRHAWVGLVASDELLLQAHDIIAELTTADLADDWLDRIATERIRVEHPSEDTPALASAYRGDARHLLTENEALTGANANLSLQAHASLSIRKPDAFALLFDPESLYEGLFGEPYLGPDRDPRA